jgi:MazG family protein
MIGITIYVGKNLRRNLRVRSHRSFGGFEAVAGQWLMVDGGDVEAISIDHQPATVHFRRLCEIVAQLRAPGGCPWDREQTHESLVPGLLEEVYEVADAIRNNDGANLREELGDLLLQVVMHAQIAREEGRFTIEDVAQEIGAKLVRRHQHVFGKSEARDTGAVLRQWDAIKRAEKGPGDTAYFAGLTRASPALLLAQKTQTKAARVGFDWSEIADVVAKVDEELVETKEAIASQKSDAIATEVGDLLFAVVNLARKNKLDAETVLAVATEKFIARFHQMEQEMKATGKKLGEVDLADG